MATKGDAPSFFQKMPSEDFLDSFLSAVLQQCADEDQRSLFSAARAHSRLHRAVTARSSIKAGIATQEHMDSMLQYASKYSQHVDSLKVTGRYCHEVSIRQLPSDLLLCSLQLRHVGVQLQQGYGFQGLLGDAAGTAALKHLRIWNCKLLGNGTLQEMEAALALLPTGLEHLSIQGLSIFDEDDAFIDRASFPSAALQPLQQLTHLELGDLDVYGPPQLTQSDTWQPLQALTLLADLRLSDLDSINITASALSHAQLLT
jgi:hypothetical protein